MGEKKPRRVRAGPFALPATAVVITRRWAVIARRRAVMARTVYRRRGHNLIGRLVVNRWRWGLNINRLLNIDGRLLDIDGAITS
jgi:hypothetical protein